VTAVPTEHSPADAAADWPDWRREIVAAVDEDPVRWLDRDLSRQRVGQLAGDRDTGCPVEQWLRTRVDGIDGIGVLNAWKRAERELAARDGREPRAVVMDLLDDRLRTLVEDGERWDRDATDRGSVPPRDERVDERTAADYRELAEESPIGVGGKAREVWGSPAEQLAAKREDGDGDEGDASPLADEFEDFADELAAEADGSVDRGTQVGPTLPDGGERE
jgi:hypothetical protein